MTVREANSPNSLGIVPCKFRPLNMLEVHTSRKFGFQNSVSKLKTGKWSSKRAQEGAAAMVFMSGGRKKGQHATSDASSTSTHRQSWKMGEKMKTYML